ncbi:NH(3)-dependent NAD(+) synthetase [Helicobacter mustelae]|uniref:NAD+ synthase n=1 Tax=Helicobacter mustelae TaxID=217 RepID=UPI000E0322A3|nr:NAD+ synthase [Helicobacter mustelae]STP12480.1 NH(3)-dependent NAD(+) synthetase [Helicobacter mustelae]
MQTHFSPKSIQNILLFLKNTLQAKSFHSVVLGLSGGIDSAVVAVLCKHAFPNTTLAISMPTLSSSKQHLEDARILCEHFEIPHIVHSIAPYEEIFTRNEKDFDTPKPSALRLGNFLARIRMNILYDYSMQKNALVIGTSNKSELMLGYGTIYGDLAYAINPIGGFFKTEIFALAKALELPDSILTKEPSADLYPDQSDAKELGYTYTQIDPLLEAIHTNFPDLSLMDQKALIGQNFDAKMVEDITTRILKNCFKQKSPIIYQA